MFAYVWILLHIMCIFCQITKTNEDGFGVKGEAVDGIKKSIQGCA